MNHARLVRWIDTYENWLQRTHQLMDTIFEKTNTLDFGAVCAGGGVLVLLIMVICAACGVH
jgi:hypothetical protein